MDVYDIAFDIDDFIYENGKYRSRMHNLRFNDSSGFQLDEWSSESVEVSNQGILLHDMVFRTPYTELKDTLELLYNDWTDFKEFPARVRLNVKLNNAQVGMYDIMVFAASLEQSSFFQNI